MMFLTAFGVERSGTRQIKFQNAKIQSGITREWRAVPQSLI